MGINFFPFAFILATRMDQLLLSFPSKREKQQQKTKRTFNFICFFSYLSWRNVLMNGDEIMLLWTHIRKSHIIKKVFFSFLIRCTDFSFEVSVLAKIGVFMHVSIRMRPNKPKSLITFDIYVSVTNNFFFTFSLLFTRSE